MRRLRQYKDKRGFTLIELILTIILVGITAIPLSLMVFEHIESLYASEDYTLARNLARSELELVNNTAYVGILTAGFPNYQGYNYDLIRTVTFVQGNAASAESLKRITVSVTKHGSAAVLLTLATYIAKNVSYGL